MPAESHTEELRTVIKQVHDGEFDYNSREHPIMSTAVKKYTTLQSLVKTPKVVKYARN